MYLYRTIVAVVEHDPVQREASVAEQYNDQTLQARVQHMLLCEAQEWAHVFPGSIQLQHNKQTGSERYGKLDYFSVDWEKTSHARSLNIHVSHLCHARMEQGHKVTSLFIYSVPLDLILVQHEGPLCSSELHGSGT
jgi:hypothetical protein